MLIPLDHIQEKPLELNGKETVECFPVLEEIQAAGDCIFIAPITYALVAAREYDHIRVTGTLSTTVRLQCSRCLTDYEAPLVSSFTIIYRRSDEAKAACEEETELSSDDLVSSTFKGDEIDMTHEIEEQVAMSVPLKPLCNEGCRGLCPDCGADLNKVACRCSERAFNFKFSALKDFKVNR